jgi:hypothetical protein
MVMIRKFFESYGVALVCLIAAIVFVTTGEASASDESDKSISISEAKWKAEDSELKIKGKGAVKRGRVEIYNAASGILLDTVTADEDGKWRSKTFPSSVPCKVKAVSHGTDDKKDVEDAPENCDDGQGNTNQPPVANDYSATTHQNTNVTVNVVQNDTDADGSIIPSTVVIKSDVSNGSITNNVDGTVLYVPASGFTGIDSFTYTVDDNEGATSNIATVTINVNAIIGSDSSINSTSQDGKSETALFEQPAPGEPGSGDGNYVVMAINDLGMHCGDFDTRISSILPPFQVLLGQVIQRGSTPILNPAGVSLWYSAASNPNDPAAGSGPTSGMRLLTVLMTRSTLAGLALHRWQLEGYR